MDSFHEHTLYELLEVGPGATLQELERAYRIARVTYQPSSAATYSIFSEEENGYTKESDGLIIER